MKKKKTLAYIVYNETEKCCVTTFPGKLKVQSKFAKLKQTETFPHTYGLYLIFRWRCVKSSEKLATVSSTLQ